MSDFGLVVWEGSSGFTGAPIVAILTGLGGGSLNPKTGPMVQAWVLRQDVAPMDAKRQNSDDAVCGTCSLRGVGGYDVACYVTVWLGPTNVYKAYRAGRYQRGDVSDGLWERIERLRQRAVRLVSPHAMRHARTHRLGWRRGSCRGVGLRRLLVCRVGPTRADRAGLLSLSHGSI